MPNVDIDNPSDYLPSDFIMTERFLSIKIRHELLAAESKKIAQDVFVDEEVEDKLMNKYNKLYEKFIELQCKGWHDYRCKLALQEILFLGDDNTTPLSWKEAGFLSLLKNAEHLSCMDMSGEQGALETLRG